MDPGLLNSAIAVEDHLHELQRNGVVQLTGDQLNISGIVAVARFACAPFIDEEPLRARLEASVDSVKQRHHERKTVYGIDTGFGGSADLRTDNHSGLENALMQTLQSGVTAQPSTNGLLPLGNEPSTLCMPSSWVRATIIARLNQCLRGHSAISWRVFESVVDLLRHDILPIVPLRGSISASGDLMPLSYLAGAIEGNPDVLVTVDVGGHVETAARALVSIGRQPCTLGPREGLGLVNGTAASVATASLAMYDSMQLLLLATSTTGLVSEALAARTEWLSPFVHAIQPHPGQIEVSRLMRRFLTGSSLVSGPEGDASLPVRPSNGLAQDRYPLRTSPQWLGPQFEDLLLALSQISTELNSTTDNPVTDAQSGSIYHVGNFQAASVTTAVEKMRSSLQMAGKMLLAQFTEVSNHTMSAGLPSNLAADEPSVSFCVKGLDINMAAYQAELAFLASPVSNHVQSAEMHNQAINSLAFISTRYTMQAIDILTLMMASSLYAFCQAIDLRVMHATYLASVLELVTSSIADGRISACNAYLVSKDLTLAAQHLQDAWWNSAAQDSHIRCDTAASAFVQALTSKSAETSANSIHHLLVDDLTVRELNMLQEQIQQTLLTAYQSHRQNFFRAPSTAQYLGDGSKAIYLYLRETLGIPMHRGLVDHPKSIVDNLASNQHMSLNGTIGDSTGVFDDTHEHAAKKMTNGFHSEAGNSQANDHHENNIAGTKHACNGNISDGIGKGSVIGNEGQSANDERLSATSTGKERAQIPNTVNGVQREHRREQKTIGSHVATIHAALKDGRLFAHNVSVLGAF